MKKNTMRTRSKGAKKRNKFGEIVHRLRKSTPAMIALSFILLLILCSVFAPLIAPYDYAKQDLVNRFQMPNGAYLLGTDEFGRDILSRLIYGGRISLLVSMMAVAISVVFALVLGATAGYFGGIYDTVIMRVLDVFMAIPGTLLTIVVAVALGTSLLDTAIAIAVGSVPALARQLRASTLLIRDEEYIEAAKSFGASNFRIIRKHVLPNTLAPVIVQVSRIHHGHCGYELYWVGHSAAYTGMGQYALCRAAIYPKLLAADYLPGNSDRPINAGFQSLWRWTARCNGSTSEALR